ncbi:MAG: alpha/beta hydrolase, partial [Bacteroidota bacterium]
HQSDCCAPHKSDWWAPYTALLSPFFELSWLDSCALAAINTMPYTQEHLHQQFVNGGIDQAVAALVRKSKEWPATCTILAFSVGGTIAWKAIQAGLNVNQFFAVSATRLRYEEVPLSVDGGLWYGSEDKFRPSTEWLAQQQLSIKILAKYGHKCYQHKLIAQSIAEQIISHIR